MSCRKQVHSNDVVFLKLHPKGHEMHDDLSPHRRGGAGGRENFSPFYQGHLEANAITCIKQWQAEHEPIMSIHQQLFLRPDALDPLEPPDTEWLKEKGHLIHDPSEQAPGKPLGRITATVTLSFILTLNAESRQ